MPPRRATTLALWKLGRMYADGDGVQHDDLKAFEYFSKLADQNADESPDSPNAGVVASAFVALGTYFLDGIKGTYVTANPARAHEMFHYAASYFSDPNAQYNLARLYLDGTGVEKDPRQAARWFNLAAEKGHHPSQALLGHLLMNGDGVPRQRARGPDVADARPRGGRSGQGQVDLRPLREGLRSGERERPQERPRLLEQYIQAPALTGSPPYTYPRSSRRIAAQIRCSFPMNALPHIRENEVQSISSSTITGTWSDGLSQARVSLRIDAV